MWYPREPTQCARSNPIDFAMEDRQFFLSPDLAHRLAAVDIGTNSIRLIIAEALRGGNYRVLDEEKETTRLGRQLNSTGRLDAQAVEQSLQALRGMKQIAQGYQVRELRVIATCAVREASDGPDFCRRVKEEIGLDVEVITSRQEAHLAFLSVVRSFALDGKNVAVADIGGGSTEIILASGNMIEAVYSTPLGAVRLTEMYGDDQIPSDHDYERLVRGIDRELRRRTGKLILRPHLLIGSGGTFTTLGEMVMCAKGRDGLPLRGYEITHAEVRHLLDRIRKLNPKARRNLPGLSPDRADIIVAGVAIVDRLMERFQVNRLQIHDRGVRDGLLLTMIDHSLGDSGLDPHDQDASIERLAASCGVDLVHARHVARLAGSICAQLAGEYGFSNSDRTVLEAAARLQDVGYLIDYEKHHKHSYHLILNSRLPGFQPHELELIANIARYHRGSEPKKKHDNFERLNSDDQRTVRRLAAILRLAGGLDRSNSQLVQAVEIATNQHELTLHVISAELPEVDIWAARRRAEPLENALRRKVVIEWQPAPNSTGSNTAPSAGGQTLQPSAVNTPHPNGANASPPAAADTAPKRAAK